MRAQKLIICAALNYRESDLRVLLRSAARHIPDSTVLLFHEQEDDKTFLEELRRDHAGVLLLAPPDMRRRRRLWRTRKRRRRLRHLPLGAGLRHAAALRTPWWTYGSAAMQVVSARFYWAEWALKRGVAGDVKHVMLCDSRDVCFQADPFEDLPGEVVTGAEASPNSERSAGMVWYRCHYPAAFVRTFEHEPIYCAGVTLGTRRGIEVYLRAMRREHNRLARYLFGRFNDQWVHNAILRRGLPVRFVATPPYDPLLVHLYSADHARFHLEEDGLKSDQGEIVRIVHHYELHESMKDHVERTYGGSAGRKM